MAGMKGRSGGKRRGAGAKKKGDLVELHALIDLHIADDDWMSILSALVKKAKQGNVPAFRELRACRFGQIPLAPAPIEEEPPAEEVQYINVVQPCRRKHADDEDYVPPPLVQSGGPDT